VGEAHDVDGIYRDTGPTLWRAIYAYTGGRRELADDCVAEAFARVLERGSSVREPVPYLFRVAFRVAGAEMKREKKPSPDAAPDRTVDPTDAADVDILAALRRLTPGQRAAIYLHYRADLPVREVAVLMGTSVATVRVQLSRGRRRLAEILGGGEAVDA
jgi:RNA polymerase sigma-70 factor (ECF subfamily)